MPPATDKCDPARTNGELCFPSAPLTTVPLRLRGELQGRAPVPPSAQPGAHVPEALGGGLVVGVGGGRAGLPLDEVLAGHAFDLGGAGEVDDGVGASLRGEHEGPGEAQAEAERGAAVAAEAAADGAG